MLRFFKKLFKKEQFPFREDWKLEARHIKTGEIIVKKGHNLIVDAGEELVGDMLIDRGAQWDTGLTYCALGEDNTAPAAGQTQLVDEGGGAAMRNTITSKSRAGSIVTLTTFFAAAACTSAIEEAGLFGTSTAGAAENSGEMFSRWLASFDNSLGSFDITITYVLTIG